MPTQPLPEFNWPPTDEELGLGREESHETAQPISKWSPTEWEVEASDSRSSVPQEPHTTVQSSLSDDALMQFRSEAVGSDTAVAPTGLRTAEPGAADLYRPPASAAVSVGSRTEGDEITCAATDRRGDADRMAVGGKTAMFDMDPLEASLATVDDVGAAFDHTGLHASSTGGWEAEIGRLQALLEGLTEKIEWHVTE